MKKLQLNQAGKNIENYNHKFICKIPFDAVLKWAKDFPHRAWVIDEFVVIEETHENFIVITNNNGVFELCTVSKL